MTGPRDWDKELAEIDKIIATGKPAPAAPAGAAPVPARDAPSRSVAPATVGGAPMVTRGRHKAGVWLRALIGVGGAVALPFWPYGNSCGTMLYLYLLASTFVALFGIWTMRGAWTHRRGVAHVVGILVMLAGMSYIAIQLLERTSYAAVRLGWTCP